MNSMNKDTYGKENSTVNYENSPKTREYVKEYQSIPIVQHFFETQPRVSRLNRLLGEHLGRPKLPTARILDLGSGVGVESALLKQLVPGSLVVSLDLSTVGSRQGKATYALNQIQGDVNNPPLPAESLSGIHCKDVLVHIKDKEAFIKNIARLLKLGGTLLLVSSIDSYTSVGQVSWSQAELLNVAEKYGLHLIDHD